MRASFFFAFLFALAPALAGPRTALAAPARATESEEDRLLREGVEARRQRDDAKALELFRRAYALHPGARTAAQMGLAEIALGRWPESEAHLEEALAARSDAWIQKNGKALQEALTRVHQHVGRLEVLGGPAGAEIVIAGESQGRLPLSKPLRVRVGDVRFEVRAKGYEPETRSVRIDAGELTRETVNLGAVAAPAPPPRAPNAPASPVALAAREPAPAAAGLSRIVETPPSPPPAARSSSSGGTLRKAGLVLSAVGVAAVGAGAVFGFKTRSASDAASSAAMHAPSDDTNGHRYQTLQFVGYGAGAALLIGGVISYLIGASR